MTNINVLGVDLTWAEKPKSRESELNVNDPKTTLEFWIASKQPNTVIDDNVIAFAVPSVVPQTYTIYGPSPNGGASVPTLRFLRNVAVKTADGVCYDVTAKYESTADRADLSFDMGTGTTKMTQSYKTMGSYNAVTAISSNTGSLASTANNDGDLAVAAGAALTALVANLTTDAGNAIILANAVGVNAGIKRDALAVASWAPAAIADGNLVKTTANLAGVAAKAAGTAASAGDAAGAATAATNAEAAAANATANLVNLAADDTAIDNADATTQADYALVGSPNANTTAAAAGSATVKTDADALYAAAVTAKNAANTAAVAARAAANASAADQAVGGNGVPDFGRAIGVNAETVEGVQVEIPKIAFSINIKKDKTTLAPGYLQTLLDLQLHTNASTYVLTVYGQTMTFSPESLKFLGAPFKLDGNITLDITFKFEASKSISFSDSITIGSSAPIVKAGWNYLWVFYTRQTDAATGRTVNKPQYVLIERVYPTADFTRFGF